MSRRKTYNPAHIVLQFGSDLFPTGPFQHEFSPTLVSMWFLDVGLPTDETSRPALSHAGQWLLTHPPKGGY